MTKLIKRVRTAKFADDASVVRGALHDLGMSAPETDEQNKATKAWAELFAGLPLTRWIVNPARREVGRHVEFTKIGPGEFLYNAPTAADAMMAGQRHLLAQAGLNHVRSERADRIEPTSSNTIDADENSSDLAEMLTAFGYDVWREGAAIVVLGGPK